VTLKWTKKDICKKLKLIIHERYVKSFKIVDVDLYQFETYGGSD